ncbi:hypothetical protein FOCG_14570 [Fusarium oxysporum f. sp. radicis-lycopersici 26381]|nr:hypothetical protein FOWG_04676 [Fusarium oxysporum f. sp. lycopersici MN25]EXL43033.1 hypothetical protein FOCG_14570 [Fusarium oxysporum f. sp. radicis-lycopersici 26381]
MGRKLSQLSFANTNGAELTSTLRRRERMKRLLISLERYTPKKATERTDYAPPCVQRRSPFSQSTMRTNIHVAPTTFPEVISETICQGSSLRVTTIQWGLARPSQAF